MRQLIFILMVTFAIGILPKEFGNSASAAYPTYRPPVSIIVGKFLPKDDEIPETPVKGDRTPSMRIPVTISMDWVEISGVDSNDILTYGIYDLDGGCMGIFNDAPSFTDIFFSLSGEYELRFTTDEYLYIGYVEL